MPDAGFGGGADAGAGSGFGGSGSDGSDNDSNDGFAGLTGGSFAGYGTDADARANSPSNVGRDNAYDGRDVGWGENQEDVSPMTRAISKQATSWGTRAVKTALGIANPVLGGALSVAADTVRGKALGENVDPGKTAHSQTSGALGMAFGTAIAPGIGTVIGGLIGRGLAGLAQSAGRTESPESQQEADNSEPDESALSRASRVPPSPVRTVEQHSFKYV